MNSKNLNNTDLLQIIYKSLNTVVLNPRKEFLARIDAISSDIDESHEAFHGEKMSLRSTLVT